MDEATLRKFSNLSNSFEIKSAKNLKKHSTHFHQSSISQSSETTPSISPEEELEIRKLRKTDNVTHDETINFGSKDSTKLFTMRKKLSKIRKKLQEEVSNGLDQYGVCESLKNTIILLSQELLDNKDTNIRRYFDYFDEISQSLSTSTPRNKQPRSKLIFTPNRNEILHLNPSNNNSLNNSNNLSDSSTSPRSISPRISPRKEINIINEAYPVAKVTVSASKKLLIKFVAEEGNYVFDLQRIEEYLIAIQKEQLLTKADEKTIFSVSAELLEFHSSLYLSLKEALKKPDCEIASIIGEKMEKFKLYQQYIINYSDASQSLEKHIKDSKNFSVIIKQNDKKDSNLQNLLRRPLRRVEEFIFALDAYGKSLSPGTKERTEVEENRDHLQEILDSIEERESVADNLARVMEIGIKITELDENLVRPDRKFILEGPGKIFKSENSKKPIADYIFLFNDVLIYCNLSGRNFEYVGRLYMHTIRVEDTVKAMTILLIENEKENYYLSTQTSEEFDDWSLYLGKVIREVERTRKVFGVPLRILMRREKDCDIPFLVEKSIKFIYDYGMNKEGIFRQTGRTTQIEKLKGQLNQGAKVFFAENMDVHTVATLFKQWLRELPDPLLTWSAYIDFMSAIEEKNEEIKIDRLKDIIDRLPRVNRFVCQHMFKCLFLLCENESKTKMNANNLAVVFAPNVLRNPDQNANPFDQSHFDRVNEIFTTLVKNYPTVFSSVEKEREKSNSQSQPSSGLKAKEKKEKRRNSNPKSLIEEGQIIKEGILQIQFDDQKKKWLQRYLILRPFSLEVSKTKEKKAKLIIDLTGSQLSSTAASGKPFSFSIDVTVPSAVTYYFAAKNSDEHDEWILHFRGAST